MKIALLTCFRTLSCTYSLANVVAKHIEMLLDHDYEVTLFVCEGCNREQALPIYQDHRLHWGEIAASYEGESIPLADYYAPHQPLPDHFSHWLSTITESLCQALQHMSLCIIHDIHFQKSNAIYHLALREALTILPPLPIIAFTHSYPYFRPADIPDSSLPHFTALPHTLYAYPTQSGLCRLSEQYDIPEAFCRPVYHPSLSLHSLEVKKIAQAVDLFTPELLIIYPARLTPAKKQDKIIALSGALKLAGNLSIQLIFCDTKGDTQEAITYKKELYQLAANYGLTPSELLFTSDIGFKNGLSHESILELFGLSNLFILPSISESFSLILLEAAARGNFLVYNENVPALLELGTLLHGYPLHWEAREDHYTILPSYDPSEASYYGHHATHILKAMHQCPILHAKTVVRRRFNAEWIWHHQMAPLLEDALSLPLK